MTIIACSNTHVAADGMKVWGSEIRGLDHKKLTIGHMMNTGKPVIFAYAGITAMHPVITDWYLQSADPKELPQMFDPEGNWSLLVINSAGLFRLTSTCPYPEAFDAPMAVGCGMDMALGAMHAGRTAREAVEMVCERHTVCGGEIQVLDIMEVTGFTLAKRVPKEVIGADALGPRKSLTQSDIDRHLDGEAAVFLGSEVRRLGLQGA